MITDHYGTGRSISLMRFMTFREAVNYFLLMILVAAIGGILNGIYDMSGNVWQWMQNEYRFSHGRSIRGGSWLEGAGSISAASRDYDVPSDRLNVIGFRLARTLPKPSGE